MERKRRSEQLSKEDHKAFIKYYHSFPTKIDAQIAFDVTRQVLDLVAIKGSGSPETIQKIREKLHEASSNKAA
jgi:hypothetical protein